MGLTGEREAVPSWSGVPVMCGSSLILPIHVTDTRHITMGPEWTHISLWHAEGGDVEYHIYRKFS